MYNKRIIFHIDVNSAFVSWSAVELLRKNPKAPDIREIASIVGGYENDRRGVVVSKSKEAKKLDIKVGESVLKVKQRYPKIVVIHPNRKFYNRCSKAFIEILKSYTDKVEQLSIDEAFVDVTELVKVDDICSILNLANDIKGQIKNKLGFTVNVGISTNRLLAKMASDFEKPDKVHTLFLEEIEEKMYGLPIEDLFGCGKATAEKLRGVGIEKIGDVLSFSLIRLQGLLGEKNGLYIYNSVRGVSSDEIKEECEEAKSYSREVTTEQDITFVGYATALNILKELSADLSLKLKREKRKVFTIGVVVKDSEFQRHSKQKTLDISTDNDIIILETAEKLYKEVSKVIFAENLGIRLIGIKLSNVDDEKYHQMTIDEIIKEGKNYGS